MQLLGIYNKAKEKESKTNMNKTLNDLQPGDKILSEGRWHKEISVVDRITKNYVIVRGGR